MLLLRGGRKEGLNLGDDVTIPKHFRINVGGFNAPTEFAPTVHYGYVFEEGCSAGLGPNYNHEVLILSTIREGPALWLFLCWVFVFTHKLKGTPLGLGISFVRSPF